MKRDVISVEADVSAANVKRVSTSGRSQNYMPPDAAHAVEQAQKAQKTLQPQAAK
ncbi:MAG: hypothetical protein ACM3PU_16635 [Gemmatimonadota bacterium]